MSSAKQCAEPNCTFFASASSPYCSKHSPEGKIAETEARARRNAEEEESLDAAAELWSQRRPAKSGDTKYLVLGATPHEERGGRVHYDNNDVYLLSSEDPRSNSSINYSRYIQADYSDKKAIELRTISEGYKNMFDEITFDSSTMCAFSHNNINIAYIFQSFYNMLKANGVFYLPQSSPEIESALRRVKFDIMKVRVEDLGGDTIVNMIQLNPDSTVIVAIKTSSNRGGRRASCIEINTKKYQTRKSPPYKAQECKNKEMKGKDGLYVSLPDKNKVYKWTKKATRETKGVKSYEIHDNGGRPFIADVTSKKVIVYKNDYNEDANDWIIGKKLLEIPYKEIFIGDNDKKQEYYDDKGVYKGNSILLKLTDSKYQYIGESIKTFDTIKGDKIKKYYSPVGNNDVPYPYAVGEKYTYLMIESVYIPNESLDMIGGPYEQYYGHVNTDINVKKEAKHLSMKTIIKRQ